MFSKAQVSVEYLMVFGFALLLLVPSTYFLATYSSESKDDIAVVRLRQIAYDVIVAADTIYTYGGSGWVTIEIDLPGNVLQAYTYTTSDISELIFNVSTNAGETELVFFSVVPIKGSYQMDPIYGPDPVSNSDVFSLFDPSKEIGRGKHTIRINQQANYVEVGEP